jgi:hypothetical protein
MSDHAVSHAPASHEEVDHHIDDVKVGTIAYWGFVSVVVTVLAIMFLHAIYVWATASQVRAKSLEYDPEHALAATRHAEQESQLEAAPHWYDEEKTMVAIPLERAIELTLEEYGNRDNSTEPAATAPAPSAAGEEAADTPAEDEVEGEGDDETAAE